MKSLQFATMQLVISVVITALLLFFVLNSLLLWWLERFPSAYSILAWVFLTPSAYLRSSRSLLARQFVVN